jgi:pyruvate,water dikinase
MNKREREKSALGNGQRSAVVWFTEETCQDVAVAGGKGASLARMTAEGLPVPPGFVIPSYVLQESIDAERMLELAASHSTRELQELVAATEPPREGITAPY